MDLEEYSALLGRILGNLHSLEFLLRAFLYANADPPHTAFPQGVSLHSIRIGDDVPINAMTDYDTLGQVIERYNRLVAPTHRKFTLDASVVDLRDALAHGRVSAADPSDSLLLVKFDRPRAGVATVTYSQPLTGAWLREQARRLHTELLKVANAPGSPIVAGR